MAIINCKEKVKRAEKVIPFSSGISFSEAGTMESHLLFFRVGKSKAGITFFVLTVNVVTKQFSIKVHLLASFNYRFHLAT